jgi:SAM-dependent methyltransferase
VRFVDAGPGHKMLEVKHLKQPVLVRVPCPICGDSGAAYERTVRGFDLERCRKCGMVFANPQYSEEGLLDLYQSRKLSDDGLIELYAQLTTSTVLADIDRVLGELEATLPGRGRILDFGCGAGYFLERALKRGWDAYGVDFGSWIYKAAAARSVANVYVGPLQDHKFPDGFFDVICANQVLEHLSSPKADLGEIRRTIRSGGLFYCNVPNYHCLSILLGRDDFELNEPPQHVNYFTPKSLRTLLETCRFKVLRTSTYGGLKWENLIGRPITSDIANAYRCEAPAALSSAVDWKPNGSAQNPLIKRLLFPAVKFLLYRLAQVGMCVEVFARPQ